MSEATGILICGGDWNIRLNPRLDSTKRSTQTSLYKKFKILTSEMGVIGLWRDFYPTGRDYTHYSCSHSLYSRIDYFIFKRDRHRVHYCEIGNMDLSYRTPLLLSLQISNNTGKAVWRLNSSILNNQQFKKTNEKRNKNVLGRE